ncbi:hypothetical protein HF521_016648 [Silurus meridionalis]|uniref:CSN8/PSMD8/EIF3K domain-containing protein n=1 Tax=Silurus meridionalis TaxID=175797 RepID=A0A8T0BRZ0_SILME|nr:hypothetical protein HF521_016648 [Silurus meridionalis]
MKSTRRRAYGLVAQAYTSISAEDFASFVGYSVEEAVKGVISHGWQADPNARMIIPQKPDPPRFHWFQTSSSWPDSLTTWPSLRTDPPLLLPPPSFNLHS